MTVKTVAGPFTESAAKETAKSLGNQFSVYARAIVDAEGYDTDGRTYWVEQDDSIVADRIFGHPTAQLMAKQYRR